MPSVGCDAMMQADFEEVEGEMQDHAHQERLLQTSFLESGLASAAVGLPGPAERPYKPKRRLYIFDYCAERRRLNSIAPFPPPLLQKALLLMCTRDIASVLARATKREAEADV